ncbi:MAG TPA: LysE family translocator [Candidatus Pelagibacter sp.]|jgi:threonine/homoserine/homoserine lactone efflux protein|nr:LysE family translocator [Candidatus Pelagibacter sp.]|tara:strand:+ start:526 stop:1131 length:606 start_codon:yes stop_codon:yes gene_type:complete
MFPLEYFLILLVLFISPGTPRILIISYSMNYGVKNCIWTSLGDISANFIQGTLVIFVIGSFFSDNSTYLNVFKWIGIIYLVYLAYDIYKSRPENINSNEHYGKSIFSFVKDGFLVAGTSPKAWLFFTTIFPTFIDFNSNYVVQFIILIITYMVLDFATLIGYAILANKAIVWIKANPKIINTISACALIAIAVYIAVTQTY